MVKINTPSDVPLARLENNVGVLSRRPDPMGGTVAEVSARLQQVVDTARDQQIDNDVRQGTLALRERLDELREKVEQDPDHGSMPQRWEELSRDVDSELTEAMASPRHERLWRERADVIMSDERRYIGQRAIERTVESARAGLIATLGALQRRMTDPDASEAARNNALLSIESAIGAAAARRVVGRDAAAQMLETARNAHNEFQNEVGMRAQAQTYEDQIFAGSPTLQTALEAAREIENPLLRDAVTARVTARFSQQENEREQNIRNSLSSAVEVLENGGSLLEIPRATRDFLVREQAWDDVRDYANSMSANPNVSNAQSDTRMNDILLEAQQDPRGFANRTDIYTDPSLNSDDRQALLQHQAYLRGETPNSESGQTLVERGYNDTIDTAVRFAEARGLDVGASGGTSTDRRQVEARSRRSQFERFIMGEVRRFVEENARAPRTLQEQEEIARLATMRVARGGNTMVFQSGQERGRRVRVRFAQIPQYNADRLMRLWRETENGGEPPTADQQAEIIEWIESAYAQELYLQGAGRE